MKKILDSISDRNINNLKEYLRRFIGLNFLDWTDEEGNTLTHKCVRANFIPGVELLINMGLNLNA